jgi:hypothetical protein
LELQNRDLEIASRFKDRHIANRETERKRHVERLITMSRLVGELETQLLQLGSTSGSDRIFPHRPESDGEIPQTN